MLGYSSSSSSTTSAGAAAGGGAAGAAAHDAIATLAPPLAHPHLRVLITAAGSPTRSRSTRQSVPCVAC